MAQIVNEGIDLVRATGHRVLDGVGTAAGGVREEVREMRERFAPPSSDHARRARWTRVATLAAPVAAAVTTYYVAHLVRNGPGARGK